MACNNNRDYNQYNQGYNPYNQDYNTQYNQQYNQGYNAQYNQQYNQGYNTQYNQQYNQGYNTQYRSTYREISPTTYNLVMGGTLFYGFIVNCLMVHFSFDAIANLYIDSPGFFYIVYFLMAFAGSYMVNKSASPVISFVGYNLIVLPLGMIISLVVNTYLMSGYSTIVSNAFAITGIVTIIMMFISSCAPDFFLSLGKTLFVTLIVTLVVELIMGLAGFDLGIVDYIVVLLFCGYIGYDWSKANALPKTVDNAIDSAANLYVDIINLFVRILRILARSQNN